MSDKLFSMNEISQYLGIPKSTIYKLSQIGEIPACKVGKQLRFRKNSVDEWFAKKEAEHPMKHKQPREAEAATIYKKRILLIENDLLVLKAITKLLTNFGFEVTQASGGGQALDIINSSDFDLIISDAKMPEINGIETIKRIRELNLARSRPHAPEVLITGYVDKETERQAHELGIKDCLYKPFSTTEFINIIRSKLKTEPEDVLKE